MANGLGQEENDEIETQTFLDFARGAFYTRFGSA